MKRLVIGLLLLFAAADGYSQIGIGMGGGGFGMGMRIPLGGGNNGARKSQSIEKQVKRMKGDLNLTDDQTIKVRGLLVERQRRSNGSNPMAVSEFNERLEQILTPEQVAILKEKRQQKQQQKQQAPPSDNKQPAPKEDNDDLYN